MAAGLDPDLVDDGAATAPLSAPARRLEGLLELEDITFGYNPNAPPLIEALSLRVSPGARIALVGATGSGKSSVAKLVAGLYSPWSGRILYDGRPRRDIPRVTLTSSLAYVDQQVFLVEGTVMDNLTMWDASIPEEAVIQAARDACIHNVIASRPGGYGGTVEERGANFSGGQRQRLEIARSLSLDPAMVVLDEATSALDARTELEIDLNLRRRGCTCLVIAHRLSTIRDADEIIVLDQGKVVERGTHDELMARGGQYERLIAAE
jgi:ABC-type bacteriocin/lantibiotic exporter with double-glycine peptidase domain